MTVIGDIQEVQSGRKEHTCHWCGQAIRVGRPSKRWLWKDSTRLRAVRVHPECYEAWGRIDYEECSFGSGERPGQYAHMDVARLLEAYDNAISTQQWTAMDDIREEFIKRFEVRDKVTFTLLRRHNLAYVVCNVGVVAELRKDHTIRYVQDGAEVL